MIDGSCSKGVMVRMPALCMRDGDPAEHFRDLTIVPGPEQKMPVIRLQAIGRNTDAGSIMSLGQNLFKRGVVRGLLE